MVRTLSSMELAILESAVSEDSCEFYSLLEWMTPCGEDGYVESFAYHYCQAYLNERENFDNIKWQNGVRVCLQEKMLSKLKSSPEASCPQIKEWGFGSHLGCYMHPLPHLPEVKYCRLSGHDLVKIGWVAKGAVFESEVRSQFYKMVTECAGHYLQDVHEDFSNYLKKVMKELEWLW